MKHIKAALTGEKRAHMPHHPLAGSSHKNARHVTVFGAAFPTTEEYALAENVGIVVARSGLVLVNGGYGGTMEASARGARSAGGTVIGITITGDRITDGCEPNSHNSVVHEATSLPMRVEKMLESEHIVVLDGSIGTLHELVAALAQKQYDDPCRHIIVFGKRNQALVQYLVENAYLPLGISETIAMPKTLEELKTLLETYIFFKLF